MMFVVKYNIKIMVFVAWTWNSSLYFFWMLNLTIWWIVLLLLTENKRHIIHKYTLDLTWIEHTFFKFIQIVHTTWTKAKHGPTERLICALPYLFEYGIFGLNEKWVSFLQFDSAFSIKLDSKAYSKAGIGTVFY